MVKTAKPRNQKLDMYISLSHLKRDEICLLIGINTSTLYRIIIGDQKPRPKLVSELCRVLHVSDPQILGLEP